MPERLNGQVSKTLGVERPTRVQISLLPPGIMNNHMTITICGSMQFHKEMAVMRDTLKAKGYRVFVPGELDDIHKNESYMDSDEERITVKIEYDFIREHFRKIEQADAILILNYEKKGIPGYIGGNTFLEMGYAFGLGKKVYLLYPVPDMDYKTEMHAIQPIVLDGDIARIGN
jgi:nucleoside 2-deoxyribosyltransferase